MKGLSRCRNMTYTGRFGELGRHVCVHGAARLEILKAIPYLQLWNRGWC